MILTEFKAAGFNLYFLTNYLLQDFLFSSVFELKDK